MRRIPLDIPPAARNAGLYINALGPEMVMGKEWFLYNMLNVKPIPGQAQPQADGSIYLPGADGSGWASNIATAYQTGPNRWKGKAFMGDLYLRGMWKMTPGVKANPGVLPFFCFWMRGLMSMLNPALAIYGKGPSLRSAEVDVWQYVMDNPLYGAVGSVLDWYRMTPNSPSVNVMQPDPKKNGSVGKFPGLYSDYHSAGVLLRRATATTPGGAVFDVDGMEVKAAVNPQGPITWKQMDTSKSLPPAVGDQAGSICDDSQFVPMWGTGPGCPTYVLFTEMWLSTMDNCIVGTG